MHSNPIEPQPTGLASSATAGTQPVVYVPLVTVAAAFRQWARLCMQTPNNFEEDMATAAASPPRACDGREGRGVAGLAPAGSASCELWQQRMAEKLAEEDAVMAAPVLAEVCGSNEGGVTVDLDSRSFGPLTRTPRRSACKRPWLPCRRWARFCALPCRLRGAWTLPS